MKSFLLGFRIDGELNDKLGSQVNISFAYA